MRAPPPSRRRALAAIVGSLAAFSTVAAPTDIGIDGAKPTTGPDRKHRHRRQAKTGLHDFDTPPPDREMVLTRRGTRERIARTVDGDTGADTTLVAVQTRRGRRWRPVAVSKNFAGLR